MHRPNLIPACAAASVFMAAVPAAAQHGATAPEGAQVSIVSLDPRFDRLVPRGTRVERIADGFTWVEGPAWDRKEQRLLFTDIPNNVIYAWSERGGVRVFLQPSGYSGAEPFAGPEPGANGLAFDAGGRLLLCQHGDRRIARLEPDGRLVPVADRFDGKRLNSPNDVFVAPSGDLYFTDPPFGLPRQFDDPGQELGFTGVYRLGRDGKLALLSRELTAPNGIALSPSGRTLYVSNADLKNPVWMAFDVARDGRVSNGRVFHDGRAHVAEAAGVPDGMDIDRDGNLFAAGPGAVYVFAPDGTLLGRINFGIAVSNTAWGDDGSTLYITASTGVYRMRLRTRGLGFRG
jgi:gluconolactonase